MKRYFFILIPLFLSCVERKAEQATSATAEVVSDTRSKLERFLDNPTDSVYQHVDLSGDSIRQMPDLSAYTIESLDLSNNQIDSVNIQNYPDGITRIDFSRNKFLGNKTFSFPKTIRVVDLSENQMTTCVIYTPVQKVYLNKNNLDFVGFAEAPDLYFLNVSDNPRLQNDRIDCNGRNVTNIDTILHKNIANTLPIAPFSGFIFKFK